MTSMEAQGNSTNFSNIQNSIASESEDKPVSTNVTQEDNSLNEKKETINIIDIKEDITEPQIIDCDQMENKGVEDEKKKKEGENNLKRVKRKSVPQERDILSGDTAPRNKRKKRNTYDRFCWRCHKESVELHCSACPRSWHRKCTGMQLSNTQNWICGECAAILHAENAETRSTVMAELSIEQLCFLLKNVVARMREHPGSEPFWKAVEPSEAPNYLDYVVKPMDMSLLESNVKAKLYGSTDAFMADAKWIQHNCIVFNTCGGVYADTSKLTNASKQIIKLARQEVSEIEACPDCYSHARNLSRSQPAWFIEPCCRPHPLVWAKLKGFPFWPAKAMPRTNSQGFVDVRFFGEHDRAWVPTRDLYLYSEEPPAPLPRKRKLDMDECVKEITRHCEKLKLIFGGFKFAPPKVQYNPNDPMQIKLLLPNYDPLNPNNPTPSKNFTPKSTVSKKRQYPNKTKLQNSSEKSNSSDIESKASEEQALIVKGNQIKSKPPEVIQEPDKFNEATSNVVTTDESNLNRSQSRKSKDFIEADENASLISKGVKSTTSKTNKNPLNGENSNVVKQDAKESNLKILERNNNIEIVNGSTKSLGNISKKAMISSKKHQNLSILKKQALPKVNTNKGQKEDPNKSLLSLQKDSFKGAKVTVFKTKSRTVGKITNAETALRSIEIEQSQKSNVTELKMSDKQQNDSNLKNYRRSLFTNKTQINNSVNIDSNDSSNIFKENATDQPISLLLASKKSIGSITEKDKSKDTSKTLSPYKQIRESKARKSFSNKPRNCPQLIPRSSSSALSNSKDSMIYNMPIQKTENCTNYQMVPPEAGPASARLFQDAQHLATKMAKLIEEAYKEAAQENNESGAISENHQATVHFLRLQMERMRWQHQQQIAELKHNTDRILREMKSSLEAERLRAVEQAHREATEEKQLCIEEIKRKQWCAKCGKEALLYCCWNTAYCDYPCQQSHWPVHMRTCAQKPALTIVTSSTVNSNQQQVMPRLMTHTQHPKKYGGPKAL